MSEPAPHPITAMPVVCRLPGMDAVGVREGLTYRAADGHAQPLAVYHPPARDGHGPLPAVVLVAGYPDEGMARILGCRFMDMESTRSWARLMAASGLVAVTYANREPAADLAALFAYLHEHGPSLGIDTSRLGVWACSGHAPLALSTVLTTSPYPLSCAALCWPYTLDLDGHTEVADAAGQFRFANPVAGRRVDDLRRDVPLFIARAGQDEMPGLNAALDRFIAAALARDLPVTLVNHAGGRHAFDIFDDSDRSRTVIRSALAFFGSTIPA